MSKIMRIVLAVFISLVLLVAWKFGGLGVEQMLYLGKMVAAWLAWTIAVSVVYWALEKVFPHVLCRSATEISPSRADGN